ncbi:MAG: hypothetical protein WKG32_16840 [Gemmatimonadaceae bacterium]
MRNALSFLLGSGWWTLWHLVLLLVVPLLIFFARWALYVTPGGGPQGGEAMLAVLMLVVLILLAGSLVSAIVWTAAAPPAGTPRGWGAYGRAIGWTLAIWIGILIATYKLANLSASTEASLTPRRAGLVALLLLLGAVYAANLYALWRFRHR